jgi:hypothetical protein
MTWGALFVVFFVSHQTGDYLFQTDWQARNKHGGLGRSSDARRALMMHTFTYTCAFVPVLIWIGESIGWKALIIAAAIALPHLFQDDGRLLAHYVRRVKGVDAAANRTVAAFVDQAFHMVALLGAALLVSALI